MVSNALRSAAWEIFSVMLICRLSFLFLNHKAEKSCKKCKDNMPVLILGQHRAIRQEVSDRIFAPIQSLENEGILYVFLVFQTEKVG